MGEKFSPQLISELAQLITGGSGHNPDRNLLYRSGTEIVKFFRSLGYDIRYGFWSRVSFTEDLLIQIDDEEDGFERTQKIIYRLVDPRDYVGTSGILENVVGRLNDFLKYDGFELVKTDSTYQLVRTESKSPVSDQFETKVLQLSLEHCRQDFQKALEDAEADPPGAITAACSTLESVCKGILDHLGKPYPKDQSIQPLFHAVIKELDIAPDQYSQEHIRRILGALVNVAAGVGALRTQYGDAHGRGLKHFQLSPRHARLAISAACTIGLFLLETYSQRPGLR